VRARDGGGGGDARPMTTKDDIFFISSFIVIDRLLSSFGPAALVICRPAYAGAGDPPNSRGARREVPAAWAHSRARLRARPEMHKFQRAASAAREAADAWPRPEADRRGTAPLTPMGSCSALRTFQEQCQARICRRGARASAPLLPLSRGARLNRGADAPYLSRRPVALRPPAPGAAVAQSVEHLICNQGVGGSIPSCGTI
jgi:hypothetical protein